MSKPSSEILKIGINLDLEPKMRYQNLIIHFDILELRKDFEKLYNQYLPQFPCIDTIISIISFLSQYKVKYYDEILYWSELFEWPFHKVLVMQLLYEINSGCTTFITEIEGKNTMIRTFDWPEPLLNKIIYQGIFFKNGKKIYEGISILGSVGIFTGKSFKGNYSLAINYRRTKEMSFSSIFQNFCNIMKSYWPVSYLLRDCLERELDYQSTKEILQKALLVSPVYYSINIFNKGIQPLIIQRGVDHYSLIQGEYTIQTNCDNEIINGRFSDEQKDEKNIEYSIERYQKVEKILNDNSKDKLEKILNKIYTFPIIRDDTIYIAIINEDQFQTLIF